MRMRSRRKGRCPCSRVPDSSLAIVERAATPDGAMLRDAHLSRACTHLAAVHQHKHVSVIRQCPRTLSRGLSGAGGVVTARCAGV